jgi:hypothetical protein
VNNVNAEVEDLKRKYEEMARQMVGGEGKSTVGELMENTNLLFTSRVMSFPLHDKFKMPWVDKFNGNGDLADHIESLLAHFILHGTPDEISCRAFPLILAGVAKEWFGRLLSNSMDDFKTLGRFFLSQFLATRKRKKNPASLLSLVQGKNESLKDFMLKFNKEKLIVESLNEQTILDALMHGVRAEGPLTAELGKKSKLLTLRQFMDKAEEYIKQEEMVGVLIKS